MPRRQRACDGRAGQRRAHPRLLQALAQASAEQCAGYGTDRQTARAVALIRNAVAQPQADVHLLVGGTQTNLIVISAFLRPHQAVIAVEAGHIATHETGAIEATGHKVLTVLGLHDKLTPALLQPVLAVHSNEHMVQPRLVYISDSTESGTIYTRAELEALSRFCRERDLLLYLDGARLAAALTANGNDLDLPTIAALTDAFYIGGTKNGVLLGEALVVIHPVLQADLRYLIKQRGALLAKGMVLSAQFATLFEDGLFFELAAHANAMAQRLRAGLLAAGVEFTSNSPTNQQFVAVTATSPQV
ncbi:threonine aldolase family protein [Xanthomonas oryzae]|uniref:Threonine aldolase n=1 Tax=Xanthomonas oryzae pv. oryzae (strain KACC10331 / KXO85) TaxID=291331 RepID=Q5GVH1_XANOR|nr:beta-eliminating lyase-related protein [Xanthomonas oryzae]AAW77302.1 Threonine aldolase [Xanthomonas oryzae pv. oryzae KACC 10331]AQU46914.1 amino acid lyase [Xanthomonas oryzae pv. oryzae]MDI9070625.1 beta-eliminating lyase-related protein [Xanthomonas oryzae pv. oryzae]MDI9081043.1 beta-eliminating lyase-related protein [Xanthomonas oryzae pv. oryzae]MDI9102515.1 beta-eliminating lyase-related protein [Xanthomonas oryzae pv. oryzae]